MKIVQIVAQGPQGPQGAVGPPPETGSLATTGSNSFSGNQTISGYVSASSFTGSLFGTSSWATQAISSSFAATASLAPNYVLNSATSSMTVLSSSFAATASYVVGGFPIVSVGNGTNVTSSASNVFSKAMLVPANSIVTGNAPTIYTRVSKNLGNGTILARMYWNTTPDMSGTPILLGTSSGNAATTRTFSFNRVLNVEVANGTGNGTVTHGTSLSNNADNGPFAGVLATGIAIDWTQAGYIVIALTQGSASDTSVCNLIKLDL